MRVLLAVQGLLLVACVSALSSYGVELTVTPERSHRFGDEEAEDLQRVVRELAMELDLKELEDPEGPSYQERFAEVDHYRFLSNANLEVIILVESGYERARILVNDREHVGSVSPRVRQIEKRIRDELMKTLADISVHSERRELGFCAP